MKRIITTNKTILVWLLSAVFIFPYVVKSAHLYQHGCRENVCYTHDCQHSQNRHDEHHGSEERSEQSGHDCTNCQICQFNISFFTKTEQIHIPDIIQVLHSVNLSEYKKSVHIHFFTANYLRAPPTC